MQKKIMLLGSGELGKEVVLALQRLGQHVIAVDADAGAPGDNVDDLVERAKAMAAKIQVDVQR